MTITKNQTQQIKGIAILLMLFLHLFNGGGGDLSCICHPLVYIGNTPLATIITNSCSPVGYFLIMSGYGLSYVFEHGSLDAKSQAKRLFNLYKTYWLTLLIFVSIGVFVRPDKYPGSISDIISNLTGWNTTYNGEMWFLFPYVLLSITSYGIFKLIDRIGNSISFVLSGFLYLVSCYVISRYIAPNHLYHEPYVLFLRI